MDGWYGLWDADNASLVGTYETTVAALVVVRRSLDADGDVAGATLVLTREGDGREPDVIAAGEELACLARQVMPILTP